MNKFPIVFSTDHNYVMPTGVTIHSLLSTSNKNYDIYILVGDDVTDEDKLLLSREVTTSSHSSDINFIDLKNEFISGYEIRGISKACYYRLLIPWLLPQYDKVIYCDVDIIFKKDISDLFNFNLGDDYIGAVHKSAFVINKKINKYIKNLGLVPQKYINSGFLLINSKKQRADNLKEKYLQLASKKFKFQDQDIINIICNNKIFYLDGNYNVSARDCNKFEPSEIKIIHYTGFKPWNTFTLSWIDWWEAFNTSTFYDSKLNFKISQKFLNKKQMLKDYWIYIKSKYFNL